MLESGLQEKSVGLKLMFLCFPSRNAYAQHNQSIQGA